MSRGVNKVTSLLFVVDDLVQAYRDGASLPMVARQFQVPISRARKHVKDAGALRPRIAGVHLAGQQGRLGGGSRGKPRINSPEARAKISAARLRHADQHAKGVSHKADGYLEHTRGPHKGRPVHVVKMEERIGRRLRPDECVHHIDGIRDNNEDNNLALMTRAGHTRLHRREQRLSRSAA